MQKRGRLSGVRIVSRGLLEDNPEARKGAAAQELPLIRQLAPTEQTATPENSEYKI